jgi:nucleoside phosphorylase
MGSEEKSSFSIGQKDPRVRNVRRHYIQKLKWIERKHFLLWDERDKRGWLVNGTSALLHLVQASLELDTTGTFSTGVLYDRFKMHYPDPHQPSSASRTLVHKSNTKLPIYDDDEPVRFEEHVVQFYEVLEKIFDYQSAAKNARSDSGTTRSRLEGWDFESLAAGRDPIFAREAKLDPAGMSWIDLIRSIEAITLLGRGFGDLIQPLTPCSRWDQVPRGKSYLTVCHEDLKEIGASWCGNLDSHPASLTDQISWHIPEDKSAIHGYDATKDSSHTDIVQVLLPSTLATPITTHSQLRTTNHTGAFIFGLNSANPWYWPETGQPSRQPVKDRFGTVENITRTVSRDSGVGSSLASSNPTRDSTDPTFRPSSPSQSRNLVSITERLTVDDYTIGIICALPIELRAVRSIFDSYHDGVFVSSTDTNAYAFGRMAQHNIVGVCLPQGDYGINSAADVASNLKRTFRFMQSCLLVGIGGGAPSTKNDIRLGDVVVSKPVGSNVGVLQYDMVKTLENGQIELNGHLQPPPRFLRSVTSLMLSDPRLSKSPLADYLLQIKEADEEYGHPGEGKDNLYYPHYSHVKGEHDTCDKCDISQVQQRSKRSTNQPHIHYGLIASGNQVMKDAKTRDDLARRHQVLCFEMEAAGVMKVVPSLIIRGICDYSDSHKSKEWQNYAAATAAAFAKHLLSHVPPGVDSENLSISMDMSTKFEGEEMFGVREARRETLNVEHGAKRRRI